MLKLFSRYLWSQKFSKVQSLLVLIVIAIGVIAYFYIKFTFKKQFKEQWNDWIDTVITILTLGVAIAVWINEKLLAWENSLPKKLHIKYMLEGKVYATVNDAPLTGENDIRSWGQSIGKTILNKTISIEFSGFKIEGPVRNDKKGIMTYHLTVYLFNKIDGIPEGSKIFFESNGNLSEHNRKEFQKTDELDLGELKK